MENSNRSMLSLNTSIPPMFTMTNSSEVSVPDGCVLKQTSQIVPWDTEDNIVSKQAEGFTNIILTGIVLPLLFLVSFPTNTLNMIVFYKHGLKERINMCFFTLSLLDCMFVTVAYGYSSDILYMFAIGKETEIGPASIFFVKNHLATLHAAFVPSQCISAVIAFERCLCITRPLLAKTLMSTKKTFVMLCVLVIGVGGGFGFLMDPRYNMICIFDPRDKSIFVTVYPNEFYFRNQEIFDFIYGMVYGIFLYGFCFTCVTVCTVITAVKMKKISKWRDSVSSASQSFSSRDLALTRMIVGTSILFIVCCMPTFVVNTAFLLVPGLTPGGPYNNLFFLLIRCCQLSLAINGTFNFFIYYFYGSKYRETVRQLFSSCMCYKSMRHTAPLESGNLDGQRDKEVK